MFARWKSLWIALGAVAYVAFAAVRSAEPPGGSRLFAVSSPFPALLLLLPLALCFVWVLTAPPSRGEDRIDAGARSAARACATGAAIVLAARAGSESAGLLALENAGAALASTASLVALARIGSLGGLVPPPPAARRLD